MAVLYGIDRIDVWKPMLVGKRIGVMTHAPAVALDYTRSVDVLCRHLNVVKLWGPEHGLDGVAQAGDDVDSSRDEQTGLQVHSLFGATGASFAETVKDVDAVVCDFCDIGCRFYTYISTMAEAMQVCAKANIPFYVLDRPNPINGVRAEGAVLEDAQKSFVGKFPIPARHGLTIGEAAQVFNTVFGINCNLTVISVGGWKREMEFEELERAWLNPSPNMPSADCARVYCGICYLEGTNVSEGRGTTRPYEMLGAPFIDGVKLAAAMNSYHIPGIAVRPCRFQPTFSKHAGIPCGGIQVIVTDRAHAHCFEAGIRMLDILRNDCPEFEYLGDGVTFDHLMGTDRFRLGKVSADEFIRQAEDESRAFQARVKDCLLY